MSVSLLLGDKTLSTGLDITRKHGLWEYNGGVSTSYGFVGCMKYESGRKTPDRLAGCLVPARGRGKMC